jgi:hypothetical protein
MAVPRRDFLSLEYRNALSALTGCDLSDLPLEVNIFHYGPGASLGAHADLPDKVVTHVLYFNDTWDPDNGGCLSILREKDKSTVVAQIPPLAGNSVVLVRSDNSWHAVSRVVNGCRTCGAASPQRSTAPAPSARCGRRATRSAAHVRSRGNAARNGRACGGG